jgi:hypothetical protein
MPQRFARQLQLPRPVARVLRYLTDACNGDIRCRKEVSVLEQNKPSGATWRSEMKTRRECGD